MYLCTKVVDLVGGEGDRSVRGLWGRVSLVVTRGDGGGGERDGNLWDVGRGAVDYGGVAICQLTAGVACEENPGSKECGTVRGWQIRVTYLNAAVEDRGDLPPNLPGIERGP